MMDLKPWYLSRTIWASLVTVLAALAGLFGLPADVLQDPAIPDLLLQAVTAVAGLIAIAGRLSAKASIG